MKLSGTVNKIDLAFGFVVALTVSTFYSGWSVGVFWASSCHPDGHDLSDCHILHVATYVCFIAAGISAVLASLMLERLTKIFYSNKGANSAVNPFTAHGWVLALAAVALCVASYAEINYTAQCTQGFHNDNCGMIHFVKQFGATFGIALTGMVAVRFGKALRG